jgi:hypothetical protein
VWPLAALFGIVMLWRSVPATRFLVAWLFARPHDRVIRRLGLAKSAHPLVDDAFRSRVTQSLKEEVARLGARIDASERDLVSFGATDGAHPFVGVRDDGTLSWCVMERGQTLEYRVTNDRDELLYWAFKGTTSTMASKWAAAHRRTGEEFRVTMWGRQFALLHAVNPAWALRCRDELIEYLRPLQPEALSLIPALPPDGDTSDDRNIAGTGETNSQH